MAVPPTATVEEARTISPQEDLSQDTQPAGTPSRGEVICAIRDAAHVAGIRCNRTKAKEVFGMLVRATARLRAKEYTEYYYLTVRDLNRLHAVLDAIMPDDASNPEPGSAHDLINRRLLLGRELSLVHTRDEPELRHCVVTIHIDAA